MNEQDFNQQNTIFDKMKGQGFVLEPGSIFAGRYEIVRTVGAGGMGTVYAVKDENRGGKQIALKILHSSLFSDLTARELLRKEVLAAEEIRSEHVVRVYDVNEAEGHYYMSMELLEGETLRTYCLRKLPMPIDVSDALAVAQQILKGLSEAHSRGIVHRDLKPANVFLKGDPEGGKFTAVILDFGIAKAMGNDLTLTTGSGQRASSVGTWGYMAQEQRNGALKVGPEADIYSVARILVDMLMGGLPMNEQQSIMAANPAVTKALDDVIFKAQSHLPHMRYASADEFADALAKAYAQPGSFKPKQQTSSSSTSTSAQSGPSPLQQSLSTSYDELKNATKGMFGEVTGAFNKAREQQKRFQEEQQQKRQEASEQQQRLKTEEDRKRREAFDEQQRLWIEQDQRRRQEQERRQQEQAAAGSTTSASTPSSTSSTASSSTSSTTATASATTTAQPGNTMTPSGPNLPFAQELYLAFRLAFGLGVKPGPDGSKPKVSGSMVIWLRVIAVILILVLLANAATSRRHSDYSSNSTNSSSDTSTSSYSTSSALSNSALATNYANEATNWGVQPQYAYFKYASMKTPMSVPGATTITTGELEAAINRGQSMALIYVGGDNQTGPAQQINLSSAFSRNQLVSSLNALTSSNADYPIVIFCHNSQCTLSYNAALQAVSAGYRNVYWYRGGLDAWNAR